MNGPESGTAQGGKYKAYDIVNRGTVVINAGDIEIHTVCPTDGIIAVADGVTGKITYETGCKGRIEGAEGGAVPSGVTIEEKTKTAQVISGEIDITVPDADAFIADANAKTAIQKGIAEVLGVSQEYVEVTLGKARRLHGESADETLRRLAGTAVKVKYTVTIPATESASLKSTAMANAQAATADIYERKFNEKLQAEGYSVTVTVTTVSEPTTTATAQATTSSAPSTIMHLGAAGSSILLARIALGQ